jgi:hypothetical protein
VGRALIEAAEQAGFEVIVIRDCLDELGFTVTDGAKALGVTGAALSLMCLI